MGRKKKNSNSLNVTSDTIETVENVEEQTNVRTKEQIEADLIEAKQRLAEAESELKEADKIEFGDEFSDYYDQTTIPIEIKNYYQNMHFHWVRTMIGNKYDTRNINKAKRKGYNFVRIPESCKDLLSLAELNSNSHIQNSLGKDVLLNDGGDNVCMMIPEALWQKRQRMKNIKIDAKSNVKAREELKQLEELQKSGDIKEADISVRNDIRR